MLSPAEKSFILIEKLKEIGILQYGNYLLKSGTYSNYYCDFRILISYPNLLKSIYELIPESLFYGIDLVCGVYFGGMPLANLISFKRNLPQIFIRNSGEKKHGTKKQIEGLYRNGQTVLLIEDVITTGSSVLDKIKILEYYGLNVVVLTILCRSPSTVLYSHIRDDVDDEDDVRIEGDREWDRDGNGSDGEHDRDGYDEMKYEKKRGKTYPINSILPLDMIISQNNTHINKQENYEKLQLYKSIVGNDNGNSSVGEIGMGLHNPLLEKLYRIAFRKKSNVILSVDLTKSQDIIDLIEETKQYIVGIKIHSDIIDDFHILLSYLTYIRNDLIIIEDCKVGDISFISLQKVKLFSTYADYITYHCLLGIDLPLSLKKTYPQLGLLGIIEMSVSGSLIDDAYIKRTESQLQLMNGCITQKNGINMFGKKLPITFSPGISLSNNTDDHNQTYKNPLNEKVGEFWIIGRSIYLAKNKQVECEKYRDIGWTHFIHYNIDTYV